MHYVVQHATVSRVLTSHVCPFTGAATEKNIVVMTVTRRIASAGGK